MLANILDTGPLEPLMFLSAGLSPIWFIHLLAFREKQRLHRENCVILYKNTITLRTMYFEKNRKVQKEQHLVAKKCIHFCTVK